MPNTSLVLLSDFVTYNAARPATQKSYSDKLSVYHNDRQGLVDLVPLYLLYNIS